MRAAIKQYLDLVERTSHTPPDSPDEQDERLRQLERVEEIMGAYIRDDPVPGIEC